MNTEEFDKAIEDIAKISDGSYDVLDYGYKILELKVKFKQAQALEDIANQIETMNSILRGKKLS
jgi:uncharacterized protein YutD